MTTLIEIQHKKVWNIKCKCKKIHTNKTKVLHLKGCSSMLAQYKNALNAKKIGHH